MVVRPKSKKPQASETSDDVSYPHTVAHPDNSQHSSQVDAPLSALLSDSVLPNSANQRGAAAPKKAAQLLTTDRESPATPSRVRIVGAQMPKQRRLFPELRPFSLVELDEPLMPERTKASFYERLKPIHKKKSFRVVARFKNAPPILVCVERIDAAFKKSGLTQDDICDLTGIKSRQTVSKILKVEDGIKVYDFCAVMNVIGVEIAELFPMRKKKPAPRMQWPRGYHHSIENMQRQLNLIEEKRRKRKKRWG